MPLPQHIERDQRAYNRQKDRLIAGHCGRIALFHDGTLIDTYASNREAYLDGCSKFGLGHFSLITVGDETAIDVGILGMCFDDLDSERLEDEGTPKTNSRFSDASGCGRIPPTSRPRW